MISPRRHGALLLPDIRPHGETTDLGDIVLGAGQSISGRVLAEDGTAAAGLYVWARSERTGLSARAARTGADGRFEIARLADGTYLLTAIVMRAPKGSTNPQAERANVAAGAKRVTLTLHRPPLLQVDLVSRASGRSVWVHRIEVFVTPLHGGAVIVRTVESKRRKPSGSSAGRGLGIS